MASLMFELGDAWAAVTFTTMDIYSPEGSHGTCRDSKPVASSDDNPGDGHLSF